MSFHFNRVLVWGACSALLLISSVAGFREQPIMRSSTAAAGQVKSQNAWAKVFGSVLLQVKKKTRVPVLLPSELPFAIEERICASGKADASGYWVSLDGCLADGNASFLAGFGGGADSNPPLYAEKTVRLARGIKGFFRSVGCGGSCAPANIWWRERNVWYQIQVHHWSAPSSAQEEQEQEKAMAATANSAILAGPR